MSLPTDLNTRLERDAIMAILQRPDDVGIDTVRRASQVGFGNQMLAVVRDAIATNIDSFGSTDWLAKIAADVPAPFQTFVTQLAVAPLPEKEELLPGYCRGITTELIARDMLKRKAELLGALQRIDVAAEPEKYAQLQRDLVLIEAERRVLRNE